MKPTVFFDLDGVLCDFVRGALAHHSRRDFPYEDVQWGIESQLNLDPAEFWRLMGRDFWASLDPYPDGMCLLRSIENFVGADRVALLTSPCDTEGCVDGKRAWVAEHLPDYRKRLFIGSAKDMFASPSKILVDDHDANLDKFRQAGGKTLAVPRPWNSWKSHCLPGGHFCVPTRFNDFREIIAEVRPKAV